MAYATGTISIYPIAMRAGTLRGRSSEMAYASPDLVPGETFLFCFAVVPFFEMGGARDGVHSGAPVCGVGGE